MNEIQHVDSIQDYNDYFSIETLHPLVTVIEGEQGEAAALRAEDHGHFRYNAQGCGLRDCEIRAQCL